MKSTSGHPEIVTDELSMVENLQNDPKIMKIGSLLAKL